MTKLHVVVGVAGKPGEFKTSFLPCATGNEVVRAGLDAGIGASGKASHWGLSVRHDGELVELVVTRTLSAMGVEGGAHLILWHKEHEQSHEHHGVYHKQKLNIKER